MTFCLDSIIMKPDDGAEIKNAIILLHGYGGSGEDISSLTLNWKRHLPNTVFVCPNGHEICPINPTGFQWFDLTKESQEYILEQSKKAEIKLLKFIDEIKNYFNLTNDDPNYILEQSIKAEKILNKFIYEVKNEFNLEKDKICLSGFSQGCMMAINLGLISDQEYSCVIGFSGKIINQHNLKSRLKVSTKTLLIHGELDQVVTPNHMLEAKDFFIRNNINIETHLIENCDHNIPVEASSIALNYISKKFNES